MKYVAVLGLCACAASPAELPPSVQLGANVAGAPVTGADGALYWVSGVEGAPGSLLRYAAGATDVIDDRVPQGTSEWTFPWPQPLAGDDGILLPIARGPSRTTLRFLPYGGPPRDALVDAPYIVPLAQVRGGVLLERYELTDELARSVALERFDLATTTRMDLRPLDDVVISVAARFDTTLAIYAGTSTAAGTLATIDAVAPDTLLSRSTNGRSWRIAFGATANDLYYAGSAPSGMSVRRVGVDAALATVTGTIVGMAWLDGALWVASNDISDNHDVYDRGWLTALRADGTVDRYEVPYVPLSLAALTDALALGALEVGAPSPLTLRLQPLPDRE